MDFFSRLFSSSAPKRTDTVSDDSSVKVRAKSESKADQTCHDSGAFCRESSVDHIEESISDNTDQPSNEKSCDKILTHSLQFIQRTLDSWNPETCVRLLRMPSVQNYSGLHKLIAASDKVWMIEFLQMGGLEVLFESVDRLSNRKKQHARLEHTLLLLQCVNCLKAVTTSRNGLEYIVEEH
ncbi:Inverted formin-2, partial [Stegodyphus mimosarum]